MTKVLAVAVAVLFLAAAAPAPKRPLLDPKPATVDGVLYGPEKIFEGDYTSGVDASDFDPLGPKGQVMWLQGWSGGDGAFHIRFIGRRTVKPSRYGDMAAHRHAVVITDMIDARPKPPS